jgi:DNA-binding LytR/AlgR family response regulator
MSLLNMKNIEETLKPHQFIRVHKSYIIPFHLIEMIGKDFSKVGKIKIPIGESYKDSFTTFLKENSLQI